MSLHLEDITTKLVNIFEICFDMFNMKIKYNWRISV